MISELPAAWRRIEDIQLPDGTHGPRWLRGPMCVVMTVDDCSPVGIWWHLSVSHNKRLPTWDEIVEVKELFMGEETAAMHLVPPRSTWVNLHPTCLHVWVRLDEDAYPSTLYEHGSLT